MGNLYDTDIAAWASEQAALLRGRQWSALDIENIAEEIDSVGRTEKRELGSRMTVLLAHLLKWQPNPNIGVTAGCAPCVINATGFPTR